MRLRALLLVASLLGSGCSWTGAIPPGFHALPPKPSDQHPYVEMHYLGNGGWLFRKSRAVIATAPFVSNPTWLALLWPAVPDEKLIDEVIPPMDEVEIVLVGHAHYDHAMDLPYIARTKASRATFYGGHTVVNVLAAAIDERRLRRVDGKDGDGEMAAVGDRPGRWLYNQARTIRFMPLRSTHAPHVAGVKLVATGSVEEKQRELPRRPLFWKEGETLAFVIDFLGPDGTVEPPGLGVMPVFEGRDRVRTDAAVLCVAAFDQVDGNPEHIVTNVHPRHVIGGHWEDFFFRSIKDPVRPTPGTSLEAFLTRVQAVSSAPVYLPKRDERLYFVIDPRR